MTIRILVADDHPIYRDGVVTSLEETGEFRVVATASSADEAVQMAEQKRPDIALLDLSMPGSGLTAIKRIAAAKSAAHMRTPSSLARFPTSSKGSPHENCVVFSKVWRRARHMCPQDWRQRS